MQNYCFFSSDDSASGFERKNITGHRDFSKVIKREIAVLEDGGGRGFYLETLYIFLLTIKPTSVDSERAFSNAGLICTKVRSRLSDQSIDTLAFLRSHFQKIRSNTAKAKEKKVMNKI
jgi:hAT family C-terminal dimerisation region